MRFTDAFLVLCLLWSTVVCFQMIVRDLTSTSGTTETDKEPLPLRTIFQIGDFTVCFHWSVIVVVVCFVIGVMYDIERFYFSYFSICFMVNVLLTLVHELGHSLTCRIVGAKVHGVFVSYRGGLCFNDGSNVDTHPTDDVTSASSIVTASMHNYIGYSICYYIVGIVIIFILL